MKLFTPPTENSALAPITAIPAYAAEHEKRTKLRAEMRALEAELRETELALHTAMTRDAGIELDQMARALVAGDEMVAGEGVETLTARMADLRLRIGAYRRADVIQKNRMADLRAELSGDAAEMLITAHRKAVAAQLAAIEALAAANAEEQAVRSALTDAGFDPVLPEMRTPFAFSPNEYTHVRWRATAEAYAA